MPRMGSGKSESRFTRRKLAASLAASAAAGMAQTAAPPADDPELTLARQRIAANGRALARQEIATSVEPAFQFKP